MNYCYALQQLYVDQNPLLVQELMPALLAWIDPEGRLNKREFILREHTTNGPIEHKFEVTWDLHAITVNDDRAVQTASRFRSGQTVQIEQKAQYAAYGLAFCAISALLPKRQVISINVWAPPDLLLDLSNSALRGVEVAGRSTKGFTAFNQVLLGHGKTKKTGAKVGKRARLQSRSDVAEGYISLWCPKPGAAWWEKVKP